MEEIAAIVTPDLFTAGVLKAGSVSPVLPTSPRGPRGMGVPQSVPQQSVCPRRHSDPQLCLVTGALLNDTCLSREEPTRRLYQLDFAGKKNHLKYATQRQYNAGEGRAQKPEGELESVAD